MCQPDAQSNPVRCNQAVESDVTVELQTAAEALQYPRLMLNSPMNGVGEDHARSRRAASRSVTSGQNAEVSILAFWPQSWTPGPEIEVGATAPVFERISTLPVPSASSQGPQCSGTMAADATHGSGQSLLAALARRAHRQHGKPDGAPATMRRPRRPENRHQRCRT